MFPNPMEGMNDVQKLLYLRECASKGINPYEHVIKNGKIKTIQNTLNSIEEYANRIKKGNMAQHIKDKALAELRGNYRYELKKLEEAKAGL